MISDFPDSSKYQPSGPGVRNFVASLVTHGAAQDALLEWTPPEKTKFSHYQVSYVLLTKWNLFLNFQMKSSSQIVKWIYPFHKNDKLMFLVESSHLYGDPMFCNQIESSWIFKNTLHHPLIFQCTNITYIIRIVLIILIISAWTSLYIRFESPRHWFLGNN